MIQLIAADLAIDRLHLVVPDGSDVSVILAAMANGADKDPHIFFGDRLAEVAHFSVSFSEDEPPAVRLALPDMTLNCVMDMPSKTAPADQLALRVTGIKPGNGHADSAKIITVTVGHPIVSATAGLATDTHRLFDWRTASIKAATSGTLYATLKLVERLESAEKLRAQTQRTKFVGTKELWRCRTCRAFWRADQERCNACHREFTDTDRRRPEVGKVELSIPDGEPILLTPDSAVLIEPEDEPNFVGRVSRVDQRRRLVEIVCRTYERAGHEGTITPSFNRALYSAKRAALASIATKNFSTGLLAQLLVSPQTICAPTADTEDTSPWLTDGMISNPPQNRAVTLLSSLGAGQAIFIQGPPGTGKTTVIVEAIKRRLAANPDERILVTSHSNLAVDNALERLDGTPGMRALRVARAERVSSVVDKFRCDDEDDPRLLQANCYFATCATAATSAITDMNFDIVILDEANKARSDEALPALKLGRALALVGDHKQLPPVEDDALYTIVEADPYLEEIINRSLFEQCWDGGLQESAKCLLTIQHRMHPQISRYISEASYDGQLEDAPEVQQYPFVTRKPLPVALHFVDTAGMKGGRERRGPGGALRNIAEARVAVQVARLLDERTSRRLSLAIIAMYADQVELLRQALGRRQFKRPVKIDTVDAFEGREDDLVVISLVRSNERGRIGFLRVPNRLNVAISRARRLVACIGDSTTLRTGDEGMYGALVDSAIEAGGLVNAAELLLPRRPGGQPAEAGAATGAGGESDQGVPRKKKRNRGRRRGRGHRPDATPTPEAPPAPAPVTAVTSETADGGTETSAANHRRRRRNRGRKHQLRSRYPRQGTLLQVQPSENVVPLHPLDGDAPDEFPTVRPDSESDAQERLPLQLPIDEPQADAS